MHNIRQLHWYSAAHCAYFFPRCYDLTDPADRVEFTEDFKCVRACALLQQAVLRAEAAGMCPPGTLAATLQRMTHGRVWEEEQESKGSRDDDGATASRPLGARLPLPPAALRTAGASLYGVPPCPALEGYVPGEPVRILPSVFRAALGVVQRRARGLDVDSAKGAPRRRTPLRALSRSRGHAQIAPILR